MLSPTQATCVGVRTCARASAEASANSAKASARAPRGILARVKSRSCMVLVCPDEGCPIIDRRTAYSLRLRNRVKWRGDEAPGRGMGGAGLDVELRWRRNGAAEVRRGRLQGVHGAGRVQRLSGLPGGR